MTGELNETR